MSRQIVLYSVLWIAIYQTLRTTVPNQLHLPLKINGSHQNLLYNNYNNIKCNNKIFLSKQLPTWQKQTIYTVCATDFDQSGKTIIFETFFTIFYTECARDRDLYNLVSCDKFVNDILFSTICKTHYLTFGHHALAVILCLCLNFLSYQQLNCFDKAKEA